MQDETYELYVAEAGHWSLRERFARAEKETAFQEAQRYLAYPSVDAVRIFHETYDPEDRLFRQRTVYRQSKRQVAPPFNPFQPPPPRQMRVQQNGQPSPLARQSPASTQAQQFKLLSQTQKLPETPPEIGRLAVISGIVALILFALGMILLSGALLGGSTLLLYASPVFLSVLTVLLFIVALGFLIQMFNQKPFPAQNTSQPTPLSPFQKKSDPVAAPKIKSEAKENSQSARRYEEELKLIEQRGMEAILGKSPLAAEPEEPVKEPTPKQSAEQATKQATSKIRPEAARDYLLSFLQESLRHPACQSFTSVDLSGHNRYACHLYMLGAAEALLEKTNTGAQELAPILGPVLETLGTTPDRLDGFLSRNAEFRQDAKYLAIIEAGRAAMSARQKQKGRQTEKLGAALQSWNSVQDAPKETNAQPPAPPPPKTKAQAAEPEVGNDIVILATQVPLTAQQQQEGLPNSLVQAHKSIVANALKHHHGHMVIPNDTGNTTVFLDIAEGLAAAFDIQRQCADYNASTMGPSLRIRIGLSVSRIADDDDEAYSNNIQLGGALAELGEPGDIFCSATFANSVRKHKTGSIDKPIEVKLKGFAQPQTVYRLKP